MATATVSGPGTDKHATVDDDRLPWAVLIVGGLGLGLIARIALAVLRARRRGS